MRCLHRLRFSLCALALATACVGASESGQDSATEVEATEVETEVEIETPAPETLTPMIERPAQPTRSASRASDLASRLPASEVLELVTETESFMALWQPANVAAPKGVILILPGEGESADWPSGIAPLRRKLPDYGWHTLSLSLPEASYVMPRSSGETQPSVPDSASVPAEAVEPNLPEEAGYLPEETAAPTEEDLSEPDTPAGEPSAEEEGATEAGTTAVTEEDSVEELELHVRIDQRISAALEHARNLEVDTIILLGQGSGAYWAARHLVQLTQDDVTRLAMVQPNQAEGQEPLADLIPALKIPVGDFYYRENTRAQHEARQRLNISRRVDHPHYHQVGLSELAGGYSVRQEQLVRRIRGWLDRPLEQGSR